MVVMIVIKFSLKGLACKAHRVAGPHGLEFGFGSRMTRLQGYLAHKKHPPINSLGAHGGDIHRDREP